MASNCINWEQLDAKKSADHVNDFHYFFNLIGYNDTYLLSLKVHGYQAESRELTCMVSLTTDGYIDADDKDNRIIDVQYLFDKYMVAITTSKGDLLLWSPDSALHSAENQLECVGSVESRFTCSAWSPDQELLVLCTGAGTFILMSSEMDPIMEQPIHTGTFFLCMILKSRTLELC